MFKADGAGGGTNRGARTAWDWGIQIDVEGSDGATDLAIDTNGMPPEGADAFIDRKEMNGGGLVFGVAAEACGEEALFLIEQAIMPENEESEAAFEFATDGIGGMGGEAMGLVVQTGGPGLGGGMGSGIAMVYAGIAGGSPLAGGRTRPGGASRVRTIGSDLSFRDPHQRHWFSVPSGKT